MPGIPGVSRDPSIGHRALWERLECGVHAGQGLLKQPFAGARSAADRQRAAAAIEPWAEAQAAMVLAVLQAVARDECKALGTPVGVGSAA